MNPTLEQLIDDRQREAYARHLAAHPEEREAFFDHYGSMLVDPDISETRREHVAELVDWMRERLRQLHESTKSAYQKHREERERILGGLKT